ncbi:MAG: hypothetical protein V8Q86_01480 [Blautia sp.]
MESDGSLCLPEKKQVFYFGGAFHQIIHQMENSAAFKGLGYIFVSMKTKSICHMFRAGCDEDQWQISILNNG